MRDDDTIAADPGAAVRGDRRPPQPGDRIGRYRIDAALGRGGMGMVFSAFDEHLERELALKLLADPEGDAERTRQLLHEARAAAGLTHPHIATIYDADTIEHAGRQVAFIAMERVRGTTLAEQIHTQGTIPDAQALVWATQLAEALATAHAAGITHRDLKPHNVMITDASGPSPGRLKLLDFGLARRHTRPVGPDTIGGSGSLAGTPMYMAPEQVRGESIDPRSDVFSFGVLVHELLSGSPGFARDSLASTLLAILNDPLPPLPEPAPGTDAAIRAGLAQLIDRCAHKNATARPADGGALTAALSALAAGSDRPRAAPAKVPTNVRPALTPLLGRADALAELDGLLADHRLVTLIGPGGAGKTRLATELALTTGDRFPGGVWFVDLAPLKDSDLVASAVGEAAGVPESPGRSVEDALRQTWADATVLIVLDNCEHVLEASASLTESLLRACPGLRVAATSREALGVAGEACWSIPTLDVPSSHETRLDTILEHAAVQLFVARAAAAKPGFAIDDEQAPVVGEIVRRLDGIPLAIELAAARTRALSLSSIRERLDERFRLLRGGSKAALPRQRTLRALVEWSYDLLDPDEQAMFTKMGVFPGTWSLDAAEAIAADDDAIDLLATLVEKSLVTTVEVAGEVRYRMLETIRELARERLQADPAAASETRRRHMEFFTRLSQEAGPGLMGPRQAEYLAILRGETDNVRDALRHAFEHDAMLGPRTLDALAWYFQSEHIAEGRALCQLALELPAAQDDSIERAHVLLALGAALWNVPEWDQAEVVLRECIEIYEREGSERLPMAWATLSSVIQCLGRPEEAAPLARRAAEEGKGNPVFEGRALGALCECHRALEQWPELVQTAERALTIFEPTGMPEGIGFSHLWLSFGLLGQGRAEEALPHAARGLELFSGQLGPYGVCMALIAGAFVALSRDAVDDAAWLAAATHRAAEWAGFEVHPNEAEALRRADAEVTERVSPEVREAAKDELSRLGIDEFLAGIPAHWPTPRSANG